MGIGSGDQSVPGWDGRQAGVGYVLWSNSSPSGLDEPVRRACLPSTASKDVYRNRPMEKLCGSGGTDRRTLARRRVAAGEGRRHGPEVDPGRAVGRQVRGEVHQGGYVDHFKEKAQQGDHVGPGVRRGRHACNESDWAGLQAEGPRAQRKTAV